MEEVKALTKEELRRLEDAYIDVDEDGYSSCAMCRRDIEEDYRYCPRCGRRLVERLEESHG